MVAVACPECSTQIDAIPGQISVCPQCGYQATVPAQEETEPEEIAPPEAESASEPLPMGALAYVMGVVAFLTFWLARFLFPFVVGAGALVLGIMAFLKDRQDRRALFGYVLGGAGLLLSVLFLFVG